MSERFLVLSGCSGGGKTTLLDELARRGHRTVPEPGRRIVAGALAGDGGPLPWDDPVAFAHRAIALALADREAAGDGWAIFDRSLIDAVAALPPSAARVALLGAHWYHARVFLVPPWRDLFANDAERRHGFGDAVAEYERLLRAYPQAGYAVSVLPRVSIGRRVDAIEDHMAACDGR